MSIKVTKLDSVKFAGQPKRGSIYDGVFAQMAKLKKGEVVTMPLNGLDKRTANNRLSSAMRRNGPKPPRGCKWVKRTTDDNKIAIFAVSLKTGK